MPAPDTSSSSSSSEETGDEQQLDAEVTMNIDRLMENMMKVYREKKDEISSTSLLIPLSLLLSQLSKDSPKGLWIASTDMILYHPEPISLSLP